MSQMSQVKRAMITAVCIALCVVLPMAFHSIQNAGAIFCPMHIPVLLCGLLVGWPYGLLCSLVGGLLIGRVIAGLFRALIFSPGSYSLAAWATGYFVTCLPGLVIQLVLVPSIVFALMKARLVPMRYPAKH